MKDIGGPAGARIVVHPQDRMPFPKDEGVLVAPGQMTTVGIRQVNDVNLDLFLFSYRHMIKQHVCFLDKHNYPF